MSPRLNSVAPAVLVLACMTSGCGKEPQQPAAPPPPIVETVVLKAERVPNIVELPGRIAAVRTAEVRARTDGIIQRRLYEEGTDVRAGTPLFLIDPRDYIAQVQSSQATLQRALATQANAAAVVRRYRPLVQERAVSAQENDSARSDLGQADGQVAEARAALARSRLLLSYTTVRAPIAGRVGRAEVTEGALVSGGQATLLTRVDQRAPVYAVFTASNASVLDAVKRMAQGGLRVAQGDVTVRLILENGDDYGPVGRLDFTDSSVDPQTGSQVIRARVDNPRNLLSPGQFVRGRIEAGTVANGLTLPARAIQFKGQEASVSIMARDGTVTNRPVTLGEMTGSRWIVRSGLKPGERVIVEGWQKVRPGQKAQLKPAPAQAPSAVASTAPAGR